MAGLIDAEAHFAITEQNGGGSVSCRMVLAMRDDDLDLLHGLVLATGLGFVIQKDRRGNPQAAWIVYRKDEASALADYLQRFPLRSRKRLDFEVWRAAVQCWQRSGAGRIGAVEGAGTCNLCYSYVSSRWDRPRQRRQGWFR